MIMKAYAKINIALDVVGLRDDGYHLLKMIMQSIDIYDAVSVTPNDDDIHINCDLENIPRDKSNTCYKAARIFLDTYNIKGGVDIDITKNIPSCAGLAGGSSDAAAVLKCMREIYKLNISDDELIDIGVKVGADVPFCIAGGTALCEGIGEIITPLKTLKGKSMILVKPDFDVYTKEVFKKIDNIKSYEHPDVDKLVQAVNKNDINFISKNMKNVLENVTLKEYPEIDKIKKLIIASGASGCLMSGSGPSVFGFFEDTVSLDKCYYELKKCYKNVFITKTI